MLPEVREILKRLRSRMARIRRLEKEKAVVELSWLRADGTVSPKAREDLAQLDRRWEEEIQAFEDGLKRMSSLGAQLKDLEEGLVDFFTTQGKTLVYLCWKEGEDRIRFWHDLTSGFAGRQPIES